MQLEDGISDVSIKYPVKEVEVYIFMRASTKRKGKMSYKGTVSLSLLCLISIFVIIFCGYSYYSYREECYDNAVREAENTANRLVEQIDERMANLQQYYASAMLEEDIKWMLENRAKYSDYSRYSVAAETMASKKIFWDYIKGYALINFRTDMVLSNKGMYSFKDAFNKDEIHGIYDDNSSSVTKTFWIFRKGEHIFDNNPTVLVDRNEYYTIEAEGLSLIMRLPIDNMNQSGMLIINIDMCTWEKWLEQWLNDYEEVVVYDASGELIYTTNQLLAERCAEMNSEMLSKNKEIKVEGDAFIPAKAQSDILGWQYYSFYNMEEEQKTAMHLSDVMLLLILLFLVLCFYVMVYIIYRPINLLMNNLGEENVEGNEFDYLANRFSDLREDKQSLENVVLQQQDKLQELFELRLIRGEVRTTEELEEYLQNLHLRQYKYYAAAVMVLNLRDEHEAQSNVSEDAICLQLVENLPEKLKEYIWMPLVYNACTLFCIFGNDDESTLLEQISSFYIEMQNYAENSYGYRMLMGVSTTHTDYRNMRGAYRESVNALTMQKNIENSSVFSENGELKADMSDCHFYLSNSNFTGSAYNNSFEKDIRAAIKGMDKEQCYKVIDEFYSYFSQFEGHDEALIYILRFVNTILLTALDARLDLNQLYPDGVKKLYEEIIEVIEPARVRRYIKRVLIDSVLQERTKLLEDNSYSIMEEIERKIASSKGNITLAECADALGVHTTYIWKVLKMEKGKSFSDYLEEYKLDEAKRLLLQTNMSVAEIAAELNYTNAQNFIRFFSKGTGVTPGKFRKLY